MRSLGWVASGLVQPSELARDCAGTQPEFDVGWRNLLTLLGIVSELRRSSAGALSITRNSPRVQNRYTYKYLSYLKIASIVNLSQPKLPASIS